MNIVLTREQGKNDSLRAWLPPEATVSDVPLTVTSYFDPVDVRAALETSPGYGAYRSLVVTSERSAAYVEIARAASSPDVQLFVVGPTTAGALVDRGVRVDERGDGSSGSLAPRISRGPVLLLGASSMRDELTLALRAKGLDVELISCYETLGVALAASDEAALRLADVLLIGAPSAWTVAREHVRADAWVVVPGASTAAAVRSDHPRVFEGWGPQLRTRLSELAG